MSGFFFWGGRGRGKLKAAIKTSFLILKHYRHIWLCALSKLSTEIKREIRKSVMGTRTSKYKFTKLPWKSRRTWRLLLRICLIPSYVYLALPSYIKLLNKCYRATTKNTNIVFLYKIHQNLGYLPEEKYRQNGRHQTWTILGVRLHWIQQTKRHTDPDRTDNILRKFGQNKVFLDYIETVKDAEISYSSSALFTCRTEHRYEY